MDDTDSEYVIILYQCFCAFNADVEIYTSSDHALYTPFVVASLCNSKLAILIAFDCSFWYNEKKETMHQYINMFTGGVVTMNSF